MFVPLFVCHANCCRSVLAQYLYENLFPGEKALSAAIEVGCEINERATAMLRHWGIDASRHRPHQINRDLCKQADAIFVMSPDHLRRLLEGHGPSLASKAYLFADPFSLPQSFRNGEYMVYDPSFDGRAIPELVREFSWFRERIIQIGDALKGESHGLVPASRYLDVLEQ